MKNLKVENWKLKIESWKLKYLSDYAKRRDFQDEADPTEKRERGFTGFPGLRAAGGEKMKVKLKIKN